MVLSAGPGFALNPMRVFFKGRTGNQGSALILVLWSLVLISFLAGEYLDHNRTKVSLAENAWNSLENKMAVASALNLFATDSWPIPDQDYKEGTWTRFYPNGVRLYVKVENESTRIPINTAADSQIKEKVLETLGHEKWDEADQLSDAILDWRDSDLLIRPQGAETAYYESQGFKPANGAFKVFTELLLVRGVTPELFWGNPMKEILPKGTDGPESTVPSLLDAFTIYPKDTKRIEIVIPGKKQGYSFITAFLQKKDGRWSILHLYRRLGITSEAGVQMFDQTETDIELS